MGAGRGLQVPPFFMHQYTRKETTSFAKGPFRAPQKGVSPYWFHGSEPFFLSLERDKKWCRASRFTGKESTLKIAEYLIQKEIVGIHPP